MVRRHVDLHMHGHAENPPSVFNFYIEGTPRRIRAALRSTPQTTAPPSLILFRLAEFAPPRVRHSTIPIAYGDGITRGGFIEDCSEPQFRLHTATVIYHHAHVVADSTSYDKNPRSFSIRFI
jgi:hypothetical protein